MNKTLLIIAAIVAAMLGVAYAVGGVTAVVQFTGMFVALVVYRPLAFYSLKLAGSDDLAARSIAIAVSFALCFFVAGLLFGFASSLTSCVLAGAFIGLLEFLSPSR